MVTVLGKAVRPDGVHRLHEFLHARIITVEVQPRN
jgi:hypothetical protein